MPNNRSPQAIEKRREYNRAYMAKKREQEKQTKSSGLSDIIQSVGGQMVNRTTNSFSTTLGNKVANEVVKTIAQPSISTLADSNSVTSKSKSILGDGVLSIIVHTGVGATLGYAGGEVVHRAVYYGQRKSDDAIESRPKFRKWGLASGAALGLLKWYSDKMFPVATPEQIADNVDVVPFQPMSIEHSNVLRYPSWSIGGRFDSWIGSEIFSGGQILIYGEAGSGKSYLCAELVTTLSRKGKTLVLVTERGTDYGERIQQLYPQFGGDMDVLYTNDRLNLDAFLTWLSSTDYCFLLIDSLNGTELNYDEQVRLMKGLRSVAPLLGVAVVSQINKDGTVKGGSALEHAVDCVIRVSDGKAVTSKNRFMQGEMELPIKFPGSNSGANIYSLPM